MNDKKIGVLLTGHQRLSSDMARLLLDRVHRDRLEVLPLPLVEERVPILQPPPAPSFPELPLVLPRHRVAVPSSYDFTPRLRRPLTPETPNQRKRRHRRERGIVRRPWQPPRLRQEERRAVANTRCQWRDHEGLVHVTHVYERDPSFERAPWSPRGWIIGLWRQAVCGASVIRKRGEHPLYSTKRTKIDINDDRGQVTCFGCLGEE